jgi:hypothetical protein
MSDPIAYGIDYAWAQIESPSIAKSGCKFVMRYLGGTARLSPAERDNHHAAGLAIALFVEQEADEAEKGFARGVQLAQVGNAEADYLGYPKECVLIYADDKNDPDPAQEVDFMRGVNSVPGGRVADMYSGGNVLAALAVENLSPFGGVCVETWYRGFGEDPCMEQLANTRDPIHIPGVNDDQFDTDLLYKSIPMWGPNGVVYLGAPAKPIEQGEDDMMYGTAAAEEKGGEAKYFKWYGQKLVEIPGIQVLLDHKAGVPFRGDCHPLEIVAMAQRVAKA